MDIGIIVGVLFIMLVAGLIELVEKVGGLEDEIKVSKITDERK